MTCWGRRLRITFTRMVLLASFCFDLPVVALEFQPQRHLADAPFFLTLQSDIPGASIWFTVNHTAPSAVNGTLYTGPISVFQTTTVRAIAISASTSSPEVVHSYIFPADIITAPYMQTRITEDPAYSGDLEAALRSLPSIHMSSATTVSRTETRISLEFIFPETGEHTQLFSGARLVGNSSLSYGKPSMRLYFRSQYGASKLKYPLFKDYGRGIPAADEFDQLSLRGGSAEAFSFPNCCTITKHYITGRVLDDTMLDMGHLYPHGRFVHLYRNGTYHGQYHMRERMHAHFLKSYYGQEKEDYEGISSGHIGYDFSDGYPLDDNDDAWERMKTASSDYLKVRDYMDVEAFIDMLLMFMHGSAQAEFRAVGHKADEPGPGFHFLLDDADGHFGERYLTLLGGDRTGSVGPGSLFRNLRNQGHPDFMMLLADRIHCAIVAADGALSPDAFRARISNRVDEVYLSMITEAARYADVNESRDAWFNLIQATAIEGWSDQRATYLLNELTAAGYTASLAAPDIQINTNTQFLTITDPAPAAGHTIYYSLESDPRAPGGAVASNALIYTAPVLLSQAGVVDVHVRIHDGTGWSAMKPVRHCNPEDYSGLRIVEVGFTDAAGTEFVEVANLGTQAVNASGCVFDQGIQGTLPVGSWLQPGERVVLALNPWKLDTASGFATIDRPIEQKFWGRLNNSGETIGLFDPKGALIEEISYEPLAGSSNALMRIDPYVSGMDPSNWVEGSQFGTPGGANENECVPATLVISELHYNPEWSGDFAQLDTGNWVEIFNNGLTPVALDGFVLHHDGQQWTLPAATLAAGGYLVLANTNALFAASRYGAIQSLSLPGLKLDNAGGYISLVGQDGCLADSLIYNDKLPWPVAADGIGPSLSLLSPGLDNTDPANWVASPNPGGSPGAVNGVNPCTIPDLVIHEIMYAPSPLADRGDWLEVVNNGLTPVDLSGLLLASEVGLMTVPAGSILAPGDWLVLASNPAQFSSQFPGVSFLPLSFDLSPKDVLGLFTAEGCVIDLVAYEDGDAWDSGADGTGSSLQLRLPGLANQDAWNWHAASPTPGAINTPAVACPVAPPQVVINELNIANPPNLGAGDWIELHNRGGTAIDVSGWRIYEGNSAHTLPNFTFIPANGYVIIAADAFAFQLVFPTLPGVVSAIGLGLRASGERVVLTDDNLCLIDEVDYSADVPWPQGEIGYGPTLALTSPNLDNALGGSWQVSANMGTPGLANTPAACPVPPAPLVINEIATVGPAGDWIELYNPGTQAVALVDWQVRDSDQVFLFPTGAVIHAQGYLVVATDPSAFAVEWPGVPLVGPLGFGLKAEGEALSLHSPYYCLVDEVSYQQTAPWPDEDVPVLSLIAPGLDNALGENWRASHPRGGTPGVANSPVCGPANPDLLALWLKSDAGVTTNVGGAVSEWLDQQFSVPFSALAAANQPILLDDPATDQARRLNFDGTDWLSSSFATYLLSEVGRGPYHLFSVSRSTDVSGFETIVSFSDTAYLGWNDDRSRFSENTHHIATVPDLVANQSVLHSVGVDPASGGFSLRSQGRERVVDPPVPSGVLANRDGAAIGSLAIAGSYHFSGDIAEVIAYRGALNAAEIRDIETYLAIKYGLTLELSADPYTSGGLVLYDEAQYPHGIAGLGRNNRDCLHVTEAQSATADSMLRVSAETPLEHNDYLVWGHDGGSPNPAALPAPPGIEERLTRSWRANLTQDPGPVTLAFDLSGLGVDFSDPANFNLLVDSDGGDFGNATLSNGVRSIEGEVVRFHNVTLSDGDGFTLGTQRGLIPVTLFMPNPASAIEHRVLNFPIFPGNLRYAFSGPIVSGMTLTPEGVFSWIPDELQGGQVVSVDIVGIETNGLSTFFGSSTLVISIAEVDEPPIITVASDATIVEGDAWSQTLQGLDSDLPAQTLTWSLSNEPVGMSLSGAILSWTPTELQGPSTQSVTVSLSDGMLNTNRTITLVVLETNTPPVLPPVSLIQIDEEVPWTYSVQVIDPDLPQGLSWELTGPVGLSIDQSGMLSWTPTEAQGPGLFGVEVRVTDPFGASDLVSFVIEVLEVSRPPVFTPGALPVAPTERHVWLYQVWATDVDGAPLTFSLGPGAPPDMQIDPLSGWLRWLPDANSGGAVYIFDVIVSDATGLSDTLPLSLTVQDRASLPTWFACTNTETLVALDAQWSWSTASSGHAWKEPWFDAAAWPQGAGTFGYGEADIVTLTTPGSLRTTFAHWFTITDVDRVLGLRLHLQRDDGAVVFLNGSEVLRDNLPAGLIDQTTQASSSIFGAAETAFQNFSIDPQRLAEGHNLLAVAVHQITANSNDMRFQARLEADALGLCPPMIHRDHLFHTGNIGWFAVPGAHYTLEHIDSLMTGNWQAVESLHALSGWEEIILSYPVPRRFYRLKLSSP